MSIPLPPLPPCPDDTYDWSEDEKDALRARDLEVARVVLEAAANFCDDEYHTGDGWGTTTADRRCAAGIRALEVKHAE